MGSFLPSGFTNTRVVFLTALLLFVLGPCADAAEIRGKVVNTEGGEPLGKIQVSVSGTKFHAVTTSDGTFRFVGLAPGEYLLQVRGVGYRNTSEVFAIASEGDEREFVIHLAPDTFRRSDVVEVHGDVFEPAAWPSVGDMNLTSSELQQTSTVIANDPYRSLQTLPGVSASGNDDFFAQFSVMGAPYEHVGVYVDDVRVPNLLHTIPSFPDAPSLSLFTGNDVEELRLMPVAFPVRYAEANGAALVITTRTGTQGHPLFHAAAGVGDSEFLGEGGFGGGHHGTWLVSARKSYIGYLQNFLDSSSFSDVGLYDANVKLTYDLTPAHTLSLFATGGQTHINDPSLPANSDPGTLKSGANDLGIGRLGWRWQISPKMQLDTRVAYVRSGYDQKNSTGVILQQQLDREWSAGTTFSWNWREGGVLEAGYSIREPHINEESDFFFGGQPPIVSVDKFSFHAQNAFVQASQSFWKNRLQLAGGLRWAKQTGYYTEPVTGQASASLKILHDTYLEAGSGKYDELEGSGGLVSCAGNPASGTAICSGLTPYQSSQTIVAIERRLGLRSRFRIEAFNRSNETRYDIYRGLPPVLIEKSVLAGRDYSRGVQFLLQRRSENRLSGWIGYTLVYARQRSFQLTIPQVPVPPVFGFPYTPTTVDQRHSVNLFASYRLTPTIRVSAKNMYGSGYPTIYFPAVARLAPYERLDLRAEKSWLFPKWKLSLYGELLNVTNHYNPVFQGIVSCSCTNPTPITSQGVPITPTAGLAFDF